MFIEKTVRKIVRFNLDDNADLESYNRLLQNPGARIINKDVYPQKVGHFEKDYSTEETHHIAFLEIEECSF